MTIRELYAAAIEQKEQSLLLLLDLLFAKKRIKFDDDVKVLDEYFKDCYHVKMNEYLHSHNDLRQIVKPKRYVQVFNIKSNKGRCFIVAETKEQALTLFQKRIGGEIYSIHAEPLHLGVLEFSTKEETKAKTWRELLTKVKKIPSIIGYYDY